MKLKTKGVNNRIDVEISNLKRIMERVEKALSQYRKLKVFDSQVKKTNINAVLEETVTFWNPIIVKHRPKMTLNTDPGLPEIFGSDGKMLMVVSNLISNSIYSMVKGKGMVID